MFLALKLLPDGAIKEIFNGPAAIAHRLTKGRKPDASGFVALLFFGRTTTSSE
jgi:hypothetical protein